jgi:hypothetical protein
MVGINGADVWHRWDLPMEWQAPPQLRVLKYSSSTFQALSSVDFSQTNQLRLIYFTDELRRRASRDTLPSKLFANLQALTMFQLDGAAFKQLPDFGPWALRLRVLVLVLAK